MTIKKFFSQQKKVNLDTQDKILLFQRIINQNSHKKENKLKRFSYFSKIYASVWLVMMTFVFVYIWFFKYSEINYKSNQKEQHIAQADNIWTIINAVWYFEITNGWRRVITDKIADQDIITLETWSIMDIHISNSIYSQIKWPAKVLVQYVWKTNWINNYRLNMIQWDYLSIHGVVSDMSNDNIEIVTSDWTIIREKQKSTNENKEEKSQTDFVFIKKDNKPIIMNKWNTKLELTNKKNNSKSEIKNESFAIINENDIKIIEKNEKDIWQNNDEKNNNTNNDLLVLEIKQIMWIEDTNPIENLTWNNTSGYNITWDYFTWQNITWNNNLNNNSWNLISKNTIKNIQKTENTQKAENTENTENIYQKDIDLEEIKKNLYWSFLLYDIDNMVRYYLLWQESSYNISIWNFSNRIDRISKILWISTDYEKNINWLILQIDKIILVSKKIELDITSLSNLIKTKNWLKKISWYEFGQFSNILEQNKEPTLEDILEFWDIKVTKSMKIKN